MHYQRRPTILFRNFGDFGYLTDNRNFGYRQPDIPIVGDKVLSQSGAIILDSLGKKLMTAEEVAEVAMKKFVGIEYDSLVDDIIEFFEQLVNEGFLLKKDGDVVCNPDGSLLGDGHYYNSKSSSCNIRSNDISTQAFFHQYFGDTPFPTSVHIEIAAACNERCVHCYLPQEIKTGTMSFEMIKKIIGQCNDMNILHVTLSGGEPMLHPDFIKILSLCKESDLSVNVLSNLTYLDEDTVIEMASNPLLSVQASLYSINESVHDAITGVDGSCKKTIQSILWLAQHHIPVQISCPIMKQNFNYFDEVKVFGEKVGIPVSADYVIIGRCDGSTSNLQYRLQMDDIESLLMEELSNPLSYNALVEEVKSNKLRSQDDYICGVCGSSLCVDVRGNVFPCAGWECCILGNINESSLRDIWYHSEKAIELRNLKWKDFVKCNSCNFIDYCIPCLVRNANENEDADPLQVNGFFCEVARLKKHIAEKLYDVTLHNKLN